MSDLPIELRVDEINARYAIVLIVVWLTFVRPIFVSSRINCRKTNAIGTLNVPITYNNVRVRGL
jgi:hypothetical protein